MLLEAGRGGEGLAALLTGEGAGAGMVDPNVPLEIARVAEVLVAVLAVEFLLLAVQQDLVSRQTRSPAEAPRTQVALVLLCRVAVLADQVVVELF